MVICQSTHHTLSILRSNVKNLSLLPSILPIHERDESGVKYWISGGFGLTGHKCNQMFEIR